MPKKSNVSTSPPPSWEVFSTSLLKVHHCTQNRLELHSALPRPIQDASLFLFLATCHLIHFCMEVAFESGMDGIGGEVGSCSGYNQKRGQPETCLCTANPTLYWAVLKGNPRENCHRGSTC